MKALRHWCMGVYNVTAKKREKVVEFWQGLNTRLRRQEMVSGLSK